jgi:hypothetical protein
MVCQVSKTLCDVVTLSIVLFRGLEQQLPDIGPLLSLLVFSIRSDNASAFAYLHSQATTLSLDDSISISSSLSEQFPLFLFPSQTPALDLSSGLLLLSLFVSVQTRSSHCFQAILQQLHSLSLTVPIGVWKDLFDLTVSSSDLILTTLLFALFLQPNDWFSSSPLSASHSPWQHSLVTLSETYRDQHLFLNHRRFPIIASPTLVSSHDSLELLSQCLDLSQVFKNQTLCASQNKPTSCCLYLQLSLYHLRDRITSSPPLLQDDEELKIHFHILCQHASSLGHPLISIMTLTCLHLLHLPLPSLNLYTMTSQTFNSIIQFLLTTKRRSSNSEPQKGQQGEQWSDPWISLFPSVLMDSVDREEFEEILYSNPQMKEPEMIEAVLLSVNPHGVEQHEVEVKVEEVATSVRGMREADHDLFDSFQHIKTAFPSNTSEVCTSTISVGKRLVTIRTRDGKSKTFTVSK